MKTGDKVVYFKPYGTSSMRYHRVVVDLLYFPKEGVPGSRRAKVLIPGSKKPRNVSVWLLEPLSMHATLDR